MGALSTSIIVQMVEELAGVMICRLLVASLICDCLFLPSSWISLAKNPPPPQLALTSAPWFWSWPFSSRRGLLCCLWAASGNRFFQPHTVHFFTNMSAQGFFPPLLLFSTSVKQVDPSNSIVSQFLHIVCFIVGEIRSCTFWVTLRSSKIKRREAGWKFGRGSVFPSSVSGFDALSLCALRGWTPWALECCCWVARYAAAWYKNETLLCKLLFGTLPIFDFAIVRLKLLDND